MKVDAKDVFELRKLTGLGIKECQMALSETGDITKAVDVLKRRSKDLVIKPKSTVDGCIFSYIHTDGKTGVLLELNCATDFVSRTEEFKTLGKDICLHIAAIQPRALYLSIEEIPESSKLLLKESAKQRGLSEEITEKVYQSSLKSCAKNNCLLEQNFIKDPMVTIKDLLKNLEIKVKEPITIKRFIRFALNES